MSTSIKKSSLPDGGSRRLVLAHAFALSERHKEHNTGECLVIEDDSYTIPEILEKFTQGLNVGTFHEQVFAQDDPDHDDPDHEKLGQLDPTERNEMLEQTRERVARQKDLLQAMQQRKTEAGGGSKSQKYKPKEDEEGTREDDDGEDDQDPDPAPKKPTKKAGGKHLTN